MNTCLKYFLVILLGLTGCLPKGASVVDEKWPVASGPQGDWTVTTENNIPTSWSVSTGENIKWKTILPEGGQSGIAVWGDKLFLTINELIPEGTTQTQPASADIIGYCINTNTGKVEWSKTIAGIKKRRHSGLFSDNTSPTPVTDGKYVWFVNTGGTIVCFDMDGNPIWSRSFEMRERHAAKQCEPMLINGQLLYVTVRDFGDPLRKGVELPEGADKGSIPDPKMWPWTYIQSYDAYTGEPIWTEAVGTSVHNTPSLGVVNGEETILHMRGGGHEPPEVPLGYSMTYVTGEKAGTTLWSHDLDDPFAYTASIFDNNFVYGINAGSFLKLESATGKLVKQFTLFDSATIYKWNEVSGSYQTLYNTSFDEIANAYRKYPTNHTAILVGKYYLFLTHRGHCIARINTETGEEEYLQVPIQVIREKGKQDELRWADHIPGDTRNSRGIQTTDEKRTEFDGWGNVTPGVPIAINDYVFFSTMLGMTYVINAQQEVFDESALVSINDLGPVGKTWSLSAPSYAHGKIFHRGLKYIVCIEKDEINNPEN